MIFHQHYDGDYKRRLPFFKIIQLIEKRLIANVRMVLLHSRTSKRKNIEETSAGTSPLKNKKINFGSIPIVNNISVCSSHSSSALVQSSPSSSLPSSSTSQGSKLFDCDIYNFTDELGDDLVNLEDVTSPHTSSTAYQW